MKKIFTFAFMAVLCASASADSLQIISIGPGTPGINFPDIQGIGLSENAEYIAGSVNYGAGAFVALRSTGEVHYALDEYDSASGMALLNVDNFGVGVGFSDFGVLFSYDGDKVEPVIAPIGYEYTIPEDITADGAMIAGSIKRESDKTLYAGYTLDRTEWTLLPLPTKEEMGKLAPRTEGSAGKKVSGDGRVIFGHLGSFEVPMIWTRNANGEFECDFFLGRYDDANVPELIGTGKELASVSAHYIDLSNNGKYAIMIGLLFDKEGKQHNVPVVYDVEKKTFKIYCDDQPIDKFDRGLYPSAIADDGTFIGTIGQPIFGATGSFIMKAGETVADSFEDEFPAYYAKLGTGDELGNNVPTDISANGRYILGYTYYADDYMDEASAAYYLTYVIDRGEDVAVETVGADAAQPEAIYSLDGLRHDAPVRGLNIIRQADGSVRKVFIK